MAQAKARLVRSRRDTLFALGLSTPFAALAAFLGWSGHGWAAGLCGTIAIGGVLMAVLGAYEAPCPGCDRPLHHLLPTINEYVRCGHCGRYARGEGSELWAMEPEHVADEPLFALELTEGLEFPRLCCVCAAPATRDEEAGVNVRELGPFQPSTEAANRRYVVRVPHCDAHEHGAILTRENVAPATGFTKEAMLSGPGMRLAVVVKVRSYAFFLKTLETKAS